ncbi:hypothetical protein [Desulfonatronum sp. SC1]|uniref:hypothetical protein n=1 Tax=Desulfonatronum sp. SC1 TaxID=2109626 RepID=UPI000D2F5C58|nr:hypothetical protein [Desulfonatronum sp. SC1]PTN33780.1 hypothetical protein C6366_13910 [Desulfonatronum sp. SC1]
MQTIIHTVQVMLALALVLSAQIAGAATFYVSPAGYDSSPPWCGAESHPCKSITKVLEAGGDMTILVARGTYDEHVGIRGNRKITIQGGWNAGFTTQSCDPSQTVITAPPDMVGDQLITVSAYSQDSPFGPKDLEVELDCLRIQGVPEAVRLGIFVGSGGDGSRLLFAMQRSIVRGFQEGIFVSARSNSSLEFNLETTEIHQNSSTGLTLRALYGATLAFQANRVRLSDNGGNAVAGAATGLLLTTDRGMIEGTLKNTIITGNSAPEGGGALQISGLDAIGDPLRDDVTLTLTNTTIHGNHQGVHGGGLRVIAAGAKFIKIRIRNTIIWGNTAGGSDADVVVKVFDPAARAEVTARHSILGNVNVPSGVFTDLGNNLNADPRLDSEQHLTFPSPARNAGICGSYRTINGIPFYIRIAPYDDFDGQNRPGFGVRYGCDIGADEFFGSLAPIYLLLLGE